MFRLPDYVETPAIVLDLDRMEANLRKTAESARRAGVRLRPHVKTHKSVWIAERQLAHGASGITVAKLGEAEVMADGGVTDILVAYPIVGKAKLERLARLHDRIRVLTSVDSYEAAKGISDVGERSGRRIPLYLDVNTGLNRCGKEPGEETAELALQIAKLPGIELTALMTHPGHVYGSKTAEESRAIAKIEAESLVMTQELLRRKGLNVPEISVGSTPTSKFIEDLTGVTEMRPGAYVFGDGSQLYPGFIEEQECALSIYATVVSMPRQGTAIIDAGSKTFSSDSSVHRPGYGYVPEYPGIIVERLSEEHGILKVPDDVKLSIGDVISIIPNHGCTVANLQDSLIGVREGRLERTIQVDARGKIQ